MTLFTCGILIQPNHLQGLTATTSMYAPQVVSDKAKVMLGVALKYFLVQDCARLAENPYVNTKLGLETNTFH